MAWKEGQLALESHSITLILDLGKIIHEKQHGLFDGATLRQGKFLAYLSGVFNPRLAGQTGHADPCHLVHMAPHRSKIWWWGGGVHSPAAKFLDLQVASQQDSIALHTSLDVQDWASASESDPVGIQGRGTVAWDSVWVHRTQSGPRTGPP